MTKKKTRILTKNHPDKIKHEITNALRRLSKIVKPYENVGQGLETQVELNISNGESLSYKLNNSWSAGIKEAVKKVILTTATAKFPQIIKISTVP